VFVQIAHDMAPSLPLAPVTATVVIGCGCPKLRAQPVTCPFVRGKWQGMICWWRCG
jgi:hypothetical protein